MVRPESSRVHKRKCVRSRVAQTPTRARPDRLARRCASLAMVGPADAPCETDEVLQE